MTLWRPADAPRKPRPTFQPIIAREPLTDAEKAALRGDSRLQVYPVAEWLSPRERAFCAFVRWRFPKGDDR